VRLVSGLREAVAEMGQARASALRATARRYWPSTPAAFWTADWALRLDGVGRRPFLLATNSLARRHGSERRRLSLSRVSIADGCASRGVELVRWFRQMAR